MLAGVLLATTAVLVGEFIAPAAEERAQLIKVTSQNQQVMLKTHYGLWLREGRQFINVRQIEDNGDLVDISIHDVDEQQHLRRSVHAERARFLGKKQWQLQNIKQSDISSEHMTNRAENERIWVSGIAPDLLKIVVVNPDNLSLYDLAMYVSFLNGNQQKSHTFEMAFWGRVVNPLVIFVMLLVSTPFVIGVRRGVSVGARILIGVVIGMGFNILDITVGHIGLIYDLSPPLMAFIPSLTVLVIALFAVKRIQ
jgi:lipopolysaccharide export system permease protein